jgi:hypothetical protein
MLTKDLIEAQKRKTTQEEDQAEWMRTQGFDQTEIDAFFEEIWQNEKAANFQAGNCEGFEKTFD